MLGLDKRFIIDNGGKPAEVKWNTFCNFIEYLQGQGVEVGTYRDDHAFRYYRKDTGKVVAWSEDRYAGYHNDRADEIEAAYCIR